MSSELEQRLQRALAQVVSGTTAEEQGREAALGALSGGSGRRGYRLGLAAAVVAAALVTAGVTLAASSTARETVGLGSASERPHHAAPLPRGALPPGSGGFSAYGNGKLWLASPGLKLTAHRYSAVELSPGALNIAVGAGEELVVRRLSDGGTAWRHPAGGEVVAAAWAPIGTEIAYVVRRSGTYQLRMIEGDGDHDRLLARDVAPVKPSWRADSLAVAFVTASGRPAVDDLTDMRTTVVAGVDGCPQRQTTSVSFAPSGELLAATIGDDDALVANPEKAWAACAHIPGPLAYELGPLLLAWVSGRSFAATNSGPLTVTTVRGHQVHLGRPVAVPGEITGLAVSPDRRALALALLRTGDMELVTARLPRGAGRLRVTRVLRRLPDWTGPGEGTTWGPPGPHWYQLIWR